MALKFKQYRYFGANDTNNSGVSLVNNQITFMNWPSGTIKRIGIQTMPGVEFNINDNSANAPNIIIGPSGTYELDVEATGATLGKLDVIENTLLPYFDSNMPSTGYLIIDVIYEGGN